MLWVCSISHPERNIIVVDTIEQCILTQTATDTPNQNALYSNADIKLSLKRKAYFTVRLFSHLYYNGRGAEQDE